MKKIMAIVTTALSCLSARAADLTVASGTTHTVNSNEDYGTVTLEGATVNLNAAQLKCQTVAATANSTIKFNGGKLAASSWDKSWFNPSSGTTLTLESVNGQDIYLDVGTQRRYFTPGYPTSFGTVVTAGSGDIVVNSSVVGDDRMYLTFRHWNVTWGHSGDLRATGSGGLKIVNPGTLPHGASTGGVRLEDSTELLVSDNSAFDVNSIEGTVRSIGTAGAPSTIRFGKYKSGTFKNAPNVGGYCVVEKHGSGTTLTLDNTGFQKLDVKGGTVIASGGATSVYELNMEAGAALNVSDTRFTAADSSAFNASSSVAIGETGVFDVVGGTDASFKLDSSGSFVKRGAGTWNVYGDNALTGRVHVAGGTVKFHYTEQQSCAQDQWWRVSITKQAYQTKGVTLAEIGLFAGSERVNGSLSATTAETSSMLNGTAKITSSDFSSGIVANLFDSNASTIWGPNWQDPSSSAPKIYGGHPLTIVMRLPSAHVGKVVTSVDISNNNYYNDHAKSFTVESSLDGVNWISRGTYNDLSRADWSNWYGGSSHFAIAEATREVEGSGHGSRGLSDNVVVRVDSGATLDMSFVKTTENVLSALEFDAAVGGGTITDAAFASHGTINILNATKQSIKTLELPLTLVRATDVDNLKNWTLLIDGVELSGYRCRYVNGMVKFTPPGLMLVLR